MRRDGTAALNSDGVVVNGNGVVVNGNVIVVNGHRQHMRCDRNPGAFRGGGPGNVSNAGQTCHECAEALEHFRCHGPEKSPRSTIVQVPRRRHGHGRRATLGWPADVARRADRLTWCARLAG
jgi:hypothetical protein